MEVVVEAEGAWTARMREDRAEPVAVEAANTTPVFLRPLPARRIRVAAGVEVPTRGAMDPAPPAGAEW